VSQLRTYSRRPGVIDVVVSVERVADRPLPELVPGTFVEIPGFRGGFGIVVAINDEDVSVLWSIEPNSIDDAGFVFAPYVPLQITPTIFAPEEFKTSGSIGRYSKALLKSVFSTIKVEDIK
jgi:hypothetical protein